MAFISTILCVDDDEDDIFFIKEVISSQNHTFRIAEAKNGSEAMEFLELSLNKDQLPCLIIMDVNMPKMDGKQAIRKIRENPRLYSIPIVIFTTSSSPEDRKFFEEQGLHFITKPFDYKIFTNQIVELLDFCADLNG